VAVSTARHEKAQQTRRRICEAAKELFLEQGYAPTTITEIARAAGVAHQTVYFVFGTKAALLAAIMDMQIVGDLDPAPLLDRPQVKRLPTISTPARRLEQLVKVAADITERLAPLYEIVRGGASDAEVRELLDRHEAQRWQSLRAMSEQLAGELADGLEPDEAADRLYALLSHETYWLLVRRRGWTAGRWRRYINTEAAKQLLDS
jgi:AcrR family transcriptional regulator